MGALEIELRSLDVTTRKLVSPFSGNETDVKKLLAGTHLDVEKLKVAFGVKR